MTESAPVDPTSTDAWKQLASIADGFSPDLRGWFATDAQRAQRYTYQAADLTIDLSKNLLTDEILAHLLQLAEDAWRHNLCNQVRTAKQLNISRNILRTYLKKADLL